MYEFPILTLMTLLPALGAFFIMTIRGDEKDAARNARHVALYTSVFTFALSIFLLARFDETDPGFQFVEYYEWLPGFGIAYHMGVDGISLLFVLLSAFLVPVCILASWNSIKTRVKEYMIAFLVMETLMIGTFCALDAVLFYVFFEAVLIPMFLIIGIWGGKRRIYAAYKFFLYTLLGSVLLLIAMLALYLEAGTTSIPALMNNPVAANMQIWLWLAFFASFAVKMPMWPVHTWLPDAHVEAPAAGSVILAGVLLKIGGYGFLRFSLPMFPDASAYFAPLVFGLSVIAIIYTSLVALVQNDMKKLIAYSSVAHMGFVTLGIFSATVQGIEGAIFQMLSHGLISGALFLCVGVVYDRLHTRELGRYGGIVSNMPRFAALFMVFMLGAVGLPGTSGFVGEFLTLLGAYQVNIWVAVLASSGVVLGAVYMLVLYRRVVFGPPVNEDAAAMPDVNERELALLVPIAVMVLVLGIFPGLIMDRISPSVGLLLTRYEAALNADPTTEIPVTEIPATEIEETAPPAEEAMQDE
jgi:NADH-quinone oxidoreductase subunit M